jgi:hypothetical protein
VLTSATSLTALTEFVSKQAKPRHWICGTTRLKPLRCSAACKPDIVANQQQPLCRTATKNNPPHFVPGTPLVLFWIPPFCVWCCCFCCRCVLLLLIIIICVVLSLLLLFSKKCGISSGSNYFWNIGLNVCNIEDYVLLWVIITWKCAQAFVISIFRWVQQGRRSLHFVADRCGQAYDGEWFGCQSLWSISLHSSTTCCVHGGCGGNVLVGLTVICAF